MLLQKEELSPWYRHVFFNWVSPLIAIGKKQHVSDEHLLTLNRAEDSAQCGKDFSAVFLEEQRSRRRPVISTLWQLHKKNHRLPIERKAEA